VFSRVDVSSGPANETECQLVDSGHHKLGAGFRFGERISRNACQTMGRFFESKMDVSEPIRHANLNDWIPAIPPRFIAEFLRARTGDLLAECWAGMLG
jgi:hypothetical protein